MKCQFCGGNPETIDRLFPAMTVKTTGFTPAEKIFNWAETMANMSVYCAKDMGVPFDITTEDVKYNSKWSGMHFGSGEYTWRMLKGTESVLPEDQVQVAGKWETVFRYMVGCEAGDVTTNNRPIRRRQYVARFGGKLKENLVQSTARDFAAGKTPLPCCEDEEFQAILKQWGHLLTTRAGMPALDMSSLTAIRHSAKSFTRWAMRNIPLYRRLRAEAVKLAQSGPMMRERSSDIVGISRALTLRELIIKQAEVAKLEDEAKSLRRQIVALSNAVTSGPKLREGYRLLQDDERVVAHDEFWSTMLEKWCACKGCLGIPKAFGYPTMIVRRSCKFEV